MPSKQITLKGILFVSSIVLASLILSVLLLKYVSIDKNYIVLVFDLCVYIPAMIAIFFWFRKHGFNMTDIGFREPKMKWFFYSMGIGLAVLVVGGGLSALLSKLLGLESTDLSSFVISEVVWVNLLQLKFITPIFIPFVEELFFRGFLFRYFQEHMITWKAIALSAIIFSFVHFSLDSAPFTLLLGIATAWVFYKTKNIFYAFMIHMVVNLLSSNMMFWMTLG
jgi:membrane protease YdiL (CAAX protease family)